MATIHLTRRGAELLKNELQRLKTVDRHAVIQAISEARGHGDLSENADVKRIHVIARSMGNRRAGRRSLQNEKRAPILT